MPNQWKPTRVSAPYLISVVTLLGFGYSTKGGHRTLCSGIPLLGCHTQENAAIIEEQF